MTKKICNVSFCKSNSMELGRLLAELQTKTIKMPFHGIDIEELNELKDTTNNFFDSCKIQKYDQNETRTIYRNIWDVQKLDRGDKIGELLNNMANKLYHSVSECDEV